MPAALTCGPIQFRTCSWSLDAVGAGPVPPCRFGLVRRMSSGCPVP